MTAASEETDDWGTLSELPGNPLMWILILSELLVFGAFLIGFAGARIVDPPGFASAQAHLDRVYGGVNTLVLITSGLCAALAARQAGRAVAACRGWLAAAGVLGVVFIAVKAAEYADKIGQGLGMDSGTFYTLYYLMTGFHALHVVLGLIFLGIVARRCTPDGVETATAFWHMVDLVWVLIYPIVYLIR